MKPVRLRRVAKQDLREAVTWYRKRDPQLAMRFLDEVYKTLATIEKSPSTGGMVYGVDDPQTRQLPVDNFPYHVVFRRNGHPYSRLHIHARNQAIGTTNFRGEDAEGLLAAILG